jgi:hypothetical protein
MPSIAFPCFGDRLWGFNHFLGQRKTITNFHLSPDPDVFIGTHGYEDVRALPLCPEIAFAIAYVQLFIDQPSLTRIANPDLSVVRDYKSRTAFKNKSAGRLK